MQEALTIERLKPPIAEKICWDEHGDALIPALQGAALARGAGFYMNDDAMVMYQYKRFVDALPRVTPFYAVKWFVIARGFRASSHHVLELAR